MASSNQDRQFDRFLHRDFLQVITMIIIGTGYQCQHLCRGWIGILGCGNSDSNKVAMSLETLSTTNPLKVRVNLTLDDIQKQKIQQITILLQTLLK